MNGLVNAGCLAQRLFSPAIAELPPHESRLSLNYNIRLNIRKSPEVTCILTPSYLGISLRLIRALRIPRLAGENVKVRDLHLYDPV